MRRAALLWGVFVLPGNGTLFHAEAERVFPMNHTIHLKKQLCCIYLSNFFSGLRITDAVWVALLAARGFSLWEIGLAESVYHIVSLLCEVPSGMAANLIRSRERLRNTYTGQQTQGDKIQPIEVQSPDDKLMERIMRVINENLSNPNLTVEMITTEVGISRVHLHRKLKELTNQTTRDFIRNIRLKQAAELLSKKRYTIAEVADLTGFTNPNNFSTAFKDLYGMPPSMYMEQHLKQDKNKEEAVSK